MKYIKATVLMVVCLLTLIIQSHAQIPQELASVYENNSNVTLGSIMVSEDHDKPQGKKITLSYVILKSRQSNTNTYPLIFLSGGPGATLISQRSIEGYLKSDLRELNDIILVDQRGNGYSSALPNMTEGIFKILADNLTPKMEYDKTKALIETYKAICEEKGIDLHFYNSTQSAKDIGVLFKHLGHEKYNLYGHSYGTLLVRVIQDIFPEYVNSSVFYSPSLRTDDFLFKRFKAYSNALKSVLDFCQGDTKCREEYPNLEKEYFSGLSRLKKNPITVKLNDSTSFTINSQDGIYLLRRLMYRNNSLENVPKYIRALNEGKGQILEDVASFELFISGIVNYSTLLSVERHESFSRDNIELINNEYKKHELLPYKLGFFDAFYKAGMLWHNTELSVSERAFKYSETPSLVFSKRFDPTTPPENAYAYKNKLKNVRLLILDEAGHASGNVKCEDKVIVNFINSPAKPVDTSCLNLFEE